MQCYIHVFALKEVGRLPCFDLPHRSKKETKKGTSKELVNSFIAQIFFTFYFEVFIYTFVLSIFVNKE